MSNTATQEKTTVEPTGAATPRPTSLPKLKPSTTEQADRIREQLTIDTTSNTIDVSREIIEPELKNIGTSFEQLTKLSTDLHNLKAAVNLATGQKVHEHWKEQKAEERGPVVATVSVWEGESTTFTHVPSSVERIPGRNETTTVYGQVNIQNHTNIGRNTGQMAATRAHLRAAAAAAFGENNG